jgi:hypothetical protein
MDTPALVSLIVAFVVAFFAWQWWARRSSGAAASPRGAPKGKNPAIAAAEPKPTAADMAAPVAPPIVEPLAEKYPEVTGQSEADLRAKEPIQERRPVAGANAQQPVGHSTELGPLPVENNLRHPEQSFHQPAPAQPRVPASDIHAGRAAGPSTPGMAGNVQQFTPEMAQNGGALLGNSVFAFDGMEPTGFAAF